MKYNIENIDIQYCSACGSVNKKSAVICCECENKIKTKRLPFCDFLIGHLKSDVRDTVSTSVFSLIRKTLVSHLYGTVLTVSVIATATVSAFCATPYIKQVKNPPTNTVNEVQPEEEVASFEITQDDIDSMLYLTTSYDALTDTTKRGGETFYEPESGPVGKFWPEGNIPGYNFSGSHSLYNNPININADLDEQHSIHEARMTIDSTLTNINLTTELGKQLQSAGYDVMECDYYMGIFTHDVNSDLNYISSWESENPDRLCVYRFVLVRGEDSDWYIADEVLTQRKGV